MPNRKLIAVVASAIIGPLITTQAFSANAEAIAFARLNASKFKSEIVGKSGVTMQSTVTVQGKLDYIDLSTYNLEYDDDDKVMIINSNIARLDSLQISEVCKSLGAFHAQNAYGAKALVKRQSCERFFVRDGDSKGAPLDFVRIEMSPSQFRQIVKSGVQVELDFTVGYPDKNEVVTYSESLDDATVREPTETQMKVWTIFGRIEEVRWYLPGTKAPIQLWHR